MDGSRRCAIVWYEMKGKRGIGGDKTKKVAYHSYGAWLHIQYKVHMPVQHVRSSHFTIPGSACRNQHCENIK